MSKSNRQGYRRFARLLRIMGTAAWVSAGLVSFALSCLIIWWRTGVDLITIIVFAPWTLILAPFYEVAGYGNWRPLVFIVALSVSAGLARMFCNWLADGLMGPAPTDSDDAERR